MASQAAIRDKSIPVSAEESREPKVLRRGKAPALDAREFRHCLGQFATGVTVVTAKGEDGYEGMSANSFAAVSLDPALVLWSIRKASRRAPVFSTAKHFVINILADSQVDASQLFASSETDPFQKISWAEDCHGVPVLDGALAHLSCTLETTHDAGDHVIIIGRVHEYTVAPGKPLLFAQGKYAQLQDDAFYEGRSAEAASVEGSLDHGTGAYEVMRQLRRAQEALSRSFDVHRQRVGLSVIEARILAILQHASLDQHDIERSIFASSAATAENLARLCTAGMVQRNAQGCYDITPTGQQKRAELSARARTFSCSRLEGLDADEIQAGQAFLLEIEKRFSTEFGSEK